MSAQVPIGDFSVMTSLSKKALPHYHEVGLLEPAHIETHTGYRFYDTSQVDHVHIIQRFRSLGMSIPDLKALLSTDDMSATRSSPRTCGKWRTILQHTQDTVGELRELLSPTRRHAQVELRLEPQITVWAITSTIDIDDLSSWFIATFDQLSEALRRAGVRPSGPASGLYARELIVESRGEVTMFIPVSDSTTLPPHPHEP